MTCHKSSDNHKFALKDAGKKQATIECQFDDNTNEKQRLRRQGLISHLNTLKTLLRQGIAIRGHTDENSNIYHFNKDKANDNEGLNLLLKENIYTYILPISFLSNSFRARGDIGLGC